MASGPVCCFCFSNRPKKGNSRRSSGDENWGKREEMLSDVSTFSVKEQEKRLKKAMEDQEKVIKEAEKVVNWVKQESSRMDVSSINIILKDEVYGEDDQRTK